MNGEGGKTAAEPLAIDVRGYSFAYPAGEGGEGACPVLRDVSLQIEQGAFCVIVGSTGCGKTTLLRSLKPELAPVGRASGTVRVLGRALCDEPVEYGDRTSSCQVENPFDEETPTSCKRLRDDDAVAQDRSSFVHERRAENATSTDAHERPAEAGAAPNVHERRALPGPATVRERSPRLSPLESAQLVGYVMQDPAAQIVCDTVWHELAFGLENTATDPDQMRRRVAEVAHFFGIEPWIRSGVEELSGGQKQLVNLAAVLALRPRLLLLDEPTAQLDPNAVKQFLFMLSRVNRELGVTVVMATHAPEDAAPYATQRIDLDDAGPVGTLEAAACALAPRQAARAEALQKAEVALSASDLHFRFDRHAPWVLRGLQLEVKRGSVHALVGGNGCGKTTLLRCLAGVLKPQRGRVRNALAASQAMLPQDPKALLVCDTVDEELMEWAGRCGYGRDEALAMAERFGLIARLASHPFDLSGGQQQNLAMAKLLLANPALLLLDEPTKGLDPASCASLSQTVASLADEGRTVVMVTHDLDFAFATADEVSMLFDGELACTEPAAEFFANNLIYRPNRESRLFGLVVDENGKGETGSFFPLSEREAPADLSRCPERPFETTTLEGLLDGEGKGHGE